MELSLDKVLSPWDFSGNELSVYACTRRHAVAKTIGIGFGILRLVNKRFRSSERFRTLFDNGSMKSFASVTNAQQYMDRAFIEAGYILYDDWNKFERVLLLI